MLVIACMAANSCRAEIEYVRDYYLMPLSATVVTKKILDSYLKPVWEQTRAIEPIYRYQENGEQILIAEGFELIKTVTGIPSFNPIDPIDPI